MSNTTLTADIIAVKALDILENNLVASKLVYRGYESEFSNSVNGYKVGDTISIRRPQQFTTGTGPVIAAQDVVEGKFSLTVDTQRWVAFKFTSNDLTLKIDDLAERVMKPGLVQMANDIDADITGLYADVWNWVGTPGQTVNSFADFALAPQRLDSQAVPQDERAALLATADYWGMAGAQTALYLTGPAGDAYRKGNVGMVGNVDTYQAQNVKMMTAGTRDNTTPQVDTVQSTTWAASKNAGTMSLITKGWDASATIEKGMVFTLAGSYAVNPVSKATLDYLQQFVVRTATSASGGGAATLTISPPIITSGAFQTVSAAPADSATITVMGTASTNYPQNLVFHKNAFTLAMVPMDKPPGAVEVARKSYKGLSVRVIPFYDGINDASTWRLDCLYGVKTIDARLATRLSGTA